MTWEGEVLAAERVRAGAVVGKGTGTGGEGLPRWGGSGGSDDEAEAETEATALADNWLGADWRPMMIVGTGAAGASMEVRLWTNAASVGDR